MVAALLLMLSAGVPHGPDGVRVGLDHVRVRQGAADGSLHDGLVDGCERVGGTTIKGRR